MSENQWLIITQNTKKEFLKISFNKLCLSVKYANTEAIYKTNNVTAILEIIIVLIGNLTLKMKTQKQNI